MDVKGSAVTPTVIVKLGYERYAARDFAGVFELLSPQIEIFQTDELPWGGSFHGHEGATRFFGLIAQYTAATPVPLKYVEAGEDVAVIGRLTGTANGTGKPIDQDIVHIWTVKEGRIVAFRAYIDTPAMLEALNS